MEYTFVRPHPELHTRGHQWGKKLNTVKTKKSTPVNNDSDSRKQTAEVLFPFYLSLTDCEGWRSPLHYTKPSPDDTFLTKYYLDKFSFASFVLALVKNFCKGSMVRTQDALHDHVSEFPICRSIIITEKSESDDCWSKGHGVSHRMRKAHTGVCRPCVDVCTLRELAGI